MFATPHRKCAASQCVVQTNCPAMPQKCIDVLRHKVQHGQYSTTDFGISRLFTHRLSMDPLETW